MKTISLFWDAFPLRQNTGIPPPSRDNGLLPTWQSSLGRGDGRVKWVCFRYHKYAYLDLLKPV